MSTYVSNPDEAKEYLGRYKIFYIAIGFALTIFTMRLWYLQIISGNELREFSEKNRIKQNKITAPRGLMLDRDGKVLVENLPGFEAILSPQYIESLDELAKTVGPVLGMEPDKVVLKVQKSRRQNGPFAQIRLKENLSREEVFRLKRMRLDTPGLEIRESIVRFYPLRENGAQLFGYVGEISKRQLPVLNDLYKGALKFDQGDIIGKSGLEETLERDIRGSDGVSFIQVDAHGRETVTQTPNIYGEQIKDMTPVHGNNAILTIDRDIQEAAFKSFMSLNRIGAVVAMRTNGEILAWVSTPSFDPNEFSTGISAQTWSKLINDPFKPLRNKVIQDHNAPGSTFKPLVAVPALQEKVITPTTIVSAPGVFYFGRRPYHDHLKGGHGNITVFEALERSSNVFFYKMGIALGVDKMFDYISLLGIGQKTGIELAREVSGTMPNSAWKKSTVGEEWQPGENLSTAIGQGFVNVTPLSMAIAYNAIGTEGKVVKPFLLRKIIDQDGKVLRENFPQVVRDLQQTQPNGVHISAETFKTVKEGMRRVANGERGTAKRYKVPGVQMAGKTGTAQVMGFSADQIYAKCESRPIHMRHHGWFIAFAPADNPEITIAALAEHSCHGSSGAAPIVRDIVEAYFMKYHPEVIEAALKATGGKRAQAPAAAPEIEGE
ncbi:Peptidoglycan D,D-transpeptidase MrdA [Bdellovibrio bacteriovorus]|uniref:penicillin-binding protein 2 n=1 Tax=Bdellovibrio bacteriovorus TaxID=959 RepID=UPI00045BF35F|nr:penicillin-binding protein 2 [Bdellovibrio bacteriovorus]AHZ84974.1 penicillin-binding protein [Bdellovibrio bacteriovorus]BEV68861.1 Peptidoglycan D,D-transpeptidase MrdA [Bdellovibrio bacteriovorus]